MNSRCKISVLIPVFFLVSVFVCAMDGSERLAIIKALKLKGLVGENNRGYLEFRSGDRQAEAVVDEENSERRKVYQDIAAKSGTSVEVVGSSRAAQIAASEEKGVWVQAPDGGWRRK